MAKFLRADADVGFSETPLGSRAGCLAGLAEGQAISPSCHHACLSLQWPLSSTRPWGGTWGLLEPGLGVCRSGSLLLRGGEGLCAGSGNSLCPGQTR